MIPERITIRNRVILWGLYSHEKTDITPIMGVIMASIIEMRVRVFISS